MKRNSRTESFDISLYASAVLVKKDSRSCNKFVFMTFNLSLSLFYSLYLDKLQKEINIYKEREREMNESDFLKIIPESFVVDTLNVMRR